MPTLALRMWAAQLPSLQLSQMFRFVFSLIHYFYSFNIWVNWKQKSVSPLARCLTHLGQTEGAVGFLAEMNITSVLKELLMPRASAESEVSWPLPESRDQTLQDIRKRERERGSSCKDHALWPAVPPVVMPGSISQVSHKADADLA